MKLYQTETIGEDKTYDYDDSGHHHIDDKQIPESSEFLDLVNDNIYHTISKLEWDNQQLLQQHNSFRENSFRRVSHTASQNSKSSKSLDYDMDIDHESFNQLFAQSLRSLTHVDYEEDSGESESEDDLSSVNNFDELNIKDDVVADYSSLTFVEEQSEHLEKTKDTSKNANSQKPQHQEQQQQRKQGFFRSLTPPKMRCKTSPADSKSKSPTRSGVVNIANKPRDIIQKLVQK